MICSYFRDGASYYVLMKDNEDTTNIDCLTITGELFAISELYM